MSTEKMGPYTKEMENSAVVRVIMCTVVSGCAGREVGIWGGRSSVPSKPSYVSVV